MDNKIEMTVKLVIELNIQINNVCIANIDVAYKRNVNVQNPTPN